MFVKFFQKVFQNTKKMAKCQPIFESLILWWINRIDLKQAGYIRNSSMFCGVIMWKSKILIIF